MTNDERPNDEGMTKHEGRSGALAETPALHSGFVIRYSFVIGFFVIRH
jgi:hypothetical protein